MLQVITHHCQLMDSHVDTTEEDQVKQFIKS